MDVPRPVPPRWARELLGVAVALAVAIAVVAVVASSARAELVFRDGDSLVTTLVVRSLAVGQPQDWAMSTVLFLPETAVLGILSLFAPGIDGALALAGVVNLLALYGALRVAAGATARSRAPIAGALLAFAGFSLLALTGTSADRDALELASLLVTTTYYSATVVGAVLAVGIARRGLERPGRWGAPVLLGAVAAESVLTNPLFAAWATAPVALVLGFVAVWRRSGAAVRLALGLMAGTAAGIAGRMPLSHLIANTGAGYADPSRWTESLGYYAGLVAERWTGPWGAVAILAAAALWAWCIAATVLLARRGAVPAAVVAACGWVLPLLVVVGAIALGTHAARYLQPAAFAPVLGLVVLPELARRATSGRVAPAVLAGAAAAVLAVAGAVGIPRIVASTNAPDADLECVVAWADASGRTGAGQFWTVRLPKSHLADPRGLVQVDHELNGYAWLVNRDDFAAREVSYLVLDAQSPPFALPGGATLDDADLVACGRYTIADFGERALPVGPQRS